LSHALVSMFFGNHKFSFAKLETMGSEI